MCKHSKQEVTVLEKRQRGLDARGNDPIAVKRESKWAVNLIQNPSDEDQALVLQHVNQLIADHKDTAAAKKLDQKIKALPTPVTAIALNQLLLDKEAGFKDLVDFVGNKVASENTSLSKKGRDQPFFKDRGRKNMPRPRRGSFSNPHGGIETSEFRTDSTSDVFDKNLSHAKGTNIGDQTSETYKKFQESGAPFVGGASGTIQFLTMDLEAKKKKKDLTKEELAEREKILVMNSAILVAGGNHSMSECLLAAKAYGYFEGVPDPLTDYDGSMAAFEKHLAKLGMGGGDEPLSRESETEGIDPEAVRYRDRQLAVFALYTRYSDQLPPAEVDKIAKLFNKARTFATGNMPKYSNAIGKLDLAETKIKGQIALITGAARGNNHVLTSSDLVAKMGQAPKTGKKSSLEYKAVQGALDDYTKATKELAGRKLDHDMAALGFEELTAALTKAKKGAEAYIAKHGGKKLAGQRNTMQEVIDKIDRELALLTKVQNDANLNTHAGDVTIEQAIEYARLEINVVTQAKPNDLKEDRIDPTKSKERFGSGAVNTVSKLVYKATTTAPKETRIFKPEPETQTLSVYFQGLGIDQKNPRLGKRNIASGKVCERLGLGEMIPPSVFTTYKGKVGLAMKMAPGKSLVKKVEVEITDTDNYVGLPSCIDERDKGVPNWEAKLPKGVIYHDNKFYKEEPRGRSLPLESPPAKAVVVAQVQKSMMNLQWLDAFSGQVDRHPENYLMDVDDQDNVTLTGIDNDFSFGSNQKDPTKKVPGLDNFCGIPPLIDRALYDTIHDLDWGTYSAGLNSELSTEELDAAKSRFDSIKLEVEKLETGGMVVDDWETFQKDGKSAKDIMMDPGDKDNPTPQNYYKRDVATQKSYRDGNKIVDD